MGIAHVPQGRGTFSELTVDENMRIGAVNRKDREIAADLDRWYSVFPTPERRRQEAGSMSGGEQMLALARAMMSRPACCCSTSRPSAWPRSHPRAVRPPG